jgi:hypothetical protein
MTFGAERVPRPRSRRASRSPRSSSAGRRIRLGPTAGTRFEWERKPVRVEVDAGQILAAPDSEPDTTIELTRAGMRGLILGARASEIEQAGDLSIQGDRRRAHALLDTLTGPLRLAALRRQLEAAA